MEKGAYMEEVKKMISNVGNKIGEKAELHEFELLRLFELIRYDQYHDFLNQILSIARNVDVSIPDQLYDYDYDTFEIYINALWEGIISSCSTLEIEVS